MVVAAENGGSQFTCTVTVAAAAGPAAAAGRMCLALRSLLNLKFFCCRRWVGTALAVHEALMPCTRAE